MKPYFLFLIALVALILDCSPRETSAQTMDPSLLANLSWRSIGPYRGGRTRAATGSAQRPNVFYMGAVNGGVWKSDDYGRTWIPIFDQEPTGSIGAIAESPSDPDILYVASGEGLHRPDLSTGDGIYKSTDAGKTWVHLGLRDGQQIPAIAIDPRDPNRVFAAVLGHPYGPNPERGVYLSTDGGQHFNKVLYVDENTGASDVVIDPLDPSTVYASLWKSREGPWENGEFAGFGGLFKSTDGGQNWVKLRDGLPGNGDSLTQVNVAIAASFPDRLYASVASGRTLGIYRSDDAGMHWRKITDDPLPANRIGGGDLPVIGVDPLHPDTVYSTSIVLWRSTDGGKDWAAFRGAPGGDDYQNIWINPLNPSIMLVTGDQGALVTVNDGRTWSSWYNQPTAQVYHVEADNAFPYNVYSGQQESGSVGIATRGNDGEITFREWHPVGAEEYGYVAPDPLDPNIVYGGKVSRYDKLTGQVQDVAPSATRLGEYRFLRTEPLLFSPTDPHTLYFAGNVLFKTRDAGHSWQVISPDLSRPTWDIPASVGAYKTAALDHMPRRGVIYTVAPSPLDGNIIWAGTDDGLIHVTRDGGKTWSDVTPSGVGSWNKISLIDAGHFGKGTAYAVVNNLRLDDMAPHIYRTHDGGKTWQQIVNGLPVGPVNAVREDPVRQGLLYAATETSVFVSFDDGDHWQSLRLNLPATSVRDLLVKGTDLVAATHGRGFWILDDIEPLRQINQAMLDSTAFLYQPADAVRVRWDMNTDTPLPPDEPAGQNPPDGAPIDYFLRDSSSDPVTLDIEDLSGRRIRHYSSTDTIPSIPHVNVPPYWIRPAQVLGNGAGTHRFLWDLHEQPLPVRSGYTMGAVFQNTPEAPTGPWVMPGRYKVVLSVNGRTYSRLIKVTMDPRVKTPATDLALQFSLSDWCYTSRRVAIGILGGLKGLQQQINTGLAGASGSAADTLRALLRTTDRLISGSGFDQPGYDRMQQSLGRLLGQLQGADRLPTLQLQADVSRARQENEKLETQLKHFREVEIPSANSLLRQSALPPLKLNPLAGTDIEDTDTDVD